MNDQPCRDARARSHRQGTPTADRQRGMKAAQREQAYGMQ